MEWQGGGSSTPSYSHVVANKSRGANRNIPQNSSENETKITDTQKAEVSKPHEKEGTHEEVQQEEKAENNGHRIVNNKKIGALQTQV